jgi:hypothetical protein
VTRVILMHKTNAHWEAGAIPSAALIARVGALVGELSQAGLFEGGEGLRPSSEGVRLTCIDGATTTTDGPFEGGNELPAGFSILRVPSLGEAVQWASREAAIVGDVEIDIRPVTEPWDIGLGRKPDDVTTRRYMVLRKATVATENDVPPSSAQREALSQLIDETTRTGVHLVTETMRPSRRGRRYKNARNGITMFDGPFIESKELIAGYTIISGTSLEDADRWARLYIDAVEGEEVDVRELADRNQ